MQSVCGCNLFCAVNILLSRNAFARIFAMRAGVNTRVRRIFALALEERVGLDFTFAFFAPSEIKRLQMRAESFIAFFGCFQFRERGFEI